MKRRDFLKLGAAISVTTSGCLGNYKRNNSQQYCVSPQKNCDFPNILILMTDQQTLNAMSSYGNPWVNTPYMDWLAAQGVRFTKSYCCMPVCAPSRSSFITGFMPHQAGVNFNAAAPQKNLPNLGKVFQQAGYKTVYFGKWHLPESYPRGWFIDVPGFDYVSIPRDISGIGLGLGDVTDNIVADQAIEFLRWKRPTNQPFLAVVAFHNPHDICYWARDKPLKHVNLDKYPPLPTNFTLDPQEPEFIHWCRERECHKHPCYAPELQYTKTWDEKQWRAYLQAYYHMTEQVDKAIGRVLGALQKAKLEDNTLIVFTSDHGDGAAAHHWVAKLMLYEESIAIPMVIAGKGIPQGVVDDSHLVSNMDLLPTLCDYAGIAAPPTTGISLKPLIEQPKQQTGRDYFVVELSVDPKRPDMMGRAIRSQRYKYIVFSMGQRPEMLFDMENDPGETHNLAYNSPSKDIVVAHREQLTTWIKQTQDHFVMPKNLT
jgi:arylsulfatase A-like enzyme